MAALRRLRSFSFVLLPPLVAALELYARLGVETDASPRAIRKAYHAKALASHPDKAAAPQKATAEQTFKALAEAYEVLSDRAMRAEYDRTGWSHAQHGSGFWWEDALVTFAVRVSSSHPDTIELLRHFGLDEDSPMPTIAWVHRDEALTHLLERPRDHRAFLDWVYARVAMRFVITNLDHRPQKCWWINGHAAEPQTTIAPGERFEQSSFLSHRWYCWPEETEGRTLTDDCATLDTYLDDVDAVDTGRVLELNATARCLDASSDCAYWKRNGECDRNYGFMQSKCRRSCGGCEKWDWLYAARLGVLHEFIRDTGVQAAEGLQRLPAAVRAQLEELCTRGRTGCDPAALRRILRGCKDESDACARWARQGECEANPTYMGEACAKSCGSCGQPSGGASRRTEKEEL